MWVGRFEGVGEAEGDDGQAGVVVCRRGDGAAGEENDAVGSLRCEVPLGAVDVAHARVPARGFEAFAQESRVCHAVLHDGSEAVEAQVDQIVVLCYYLRSWPGEVQRVGLLRAAEVVEFEDEVFWEVGCVAPDYPADAGVDEAKFVAGCVDGFDAGEFEVPI